MNPETLAHLLLAAAVLVVLGGGVYGYVRLGGLLDDLAVDVAVDRESAAEKFQTLRRADDDLAEGVGAQAARLSAFWKASRVQDERHVVIRDDLRRLNALLLDAHKRIEAQAHEAEKLRCRAEAARDCVFVTPGPGCADLPPRADDLSGVLGRYAASVAGMKQAAGDGRLRSEEENLATLNGLNQLLHGFGAGAA